MFQSPVPLPPSRPADGLDGETGNSASSDVNVVEGLGPCPALQPQNWNNCVGNLKIADRGIYSGEFRNGRPDGTGVFNSRDGSVYQGEFRDGIPAGKGKFSTPNGNVYAGEFANGVANGEGTEQIADGSRYIGSFANGVREGKGRLTFPDGRIFEGDFKADKFEGNGTFTFPDGNSYTGVFADNEPTERGIYRFANGDRYVGQFKNFKPAGQGVLTFASGRKFIGSFEDGEPKGPGAFYDQTGALINEGEFSGLSSLESAWKQYEAGLQPKATSRLAQSTGADGVSDDTQSFNSAQIAAMPDVKTPSRHEDATTGTVSDIPISATVNNTGSASFNASQDAQANPPNQSLSAPQNAPAGTTQLEPNRDVSAPANEPVAQVPQNADQSAKATTSSGKPPLDCKRSGDLLIAFIVCSVEATQVEIEDIRFPNSTCQSGRDYLKDYDQARSAPWYDVVTLFKAYFYFRPFDFRGSHRFRDEVYFLVRKCSAAADFTIRIQNEEWSWPSEGPPVLNR